MNKSASPKWIIDTNWGVGIDPYNWILYERSGKGWRPAGYYPSAAQLLESFYRKLTCSEIADTDLVRHLESLSDRAQAAASALHDAIHAERAWPSLKELRHAS